MPEEAALADRGFVVDADDPSYQVVGKLSVADFDSAFLRSANHISGFVVDLFFPPVFVSRKLKHGRAVPFKTVLKSRSAIRHPLDERE